MYLLDANLLIAMGDPNHEHHARSHGWFHSEPGRAWATCPLTENAFLRIMGSAEYPGGIGDPAVLRDLLAQMCSFPGHQFWSADLSVRDASLFPDLTSTRMLTDVYLLALAVAHRAKLATLARRIDPRLIPAGDTAYFLIP